MRRGDTGANESSFRLQLPGLQLHFVDVAPTPILAGFEGPHDGVPGGMEMLGSVLVFGRIAATDVSAR